MHSHSVFEPIRGFFQHGSIPLTKALIVSNVVSLFFAVTAPGDALIGNLIFQTSTMLLRPWTLITYPFAVLLDPITVLFSGFWMWQIGGSLERAWGTRTFALFFGSVAAVSALSLAVGMRVLLPASVLSLTLYGLWLPLAGLTVAFCLINWNVDMCFWTIPIKAQHLMALVIALDFLMYAGRGGPLLGLFALGGCGYAYLQMRWLRWSLHRPSTTVGWRGRQIELAPQPERRRAPTNPFEAFARWKRKRDFARLMKQSGLDDADSESREIPPR